jgi:hypothetical protein
MALKLFETKKGAAAKRAKYVNTCPCCAVVVCVMVSCGVTLYVCQFFRVEMW